MKIDINEEILINLRKIIRAIDLQSKFLIKNFELTGPQAIILKELARHQMLSSGELSRLVNLSQATVTSIIDRLVKKGLVERIRAQDDRRKVCISLTSLGLDKSKQSYSVLQEDFIDKLNQLEKWEQMQILAVLERLADLMSASEIDAEPLLAEVVE